MGVQNKQKRIAKSKTPQPLKKVKGHGQVKTPQSAPPIKRKNLAQEIDEELSDVDFDELLEKVKVAEGKSPKNGRPTKKVDSEEDDSDDYSFDEAGEEQETSDDEDDDDFDEDDSDDDDISESDEDEEVSGSVFESPKITAKKQTPSKQKLAETKSTPSKQKLLLEAKSTPSKSTPSKSTPSKQKLLEARSTPSKQKLLEAKSTPSKQNLLEARSTPSKQKLLEAKSTPSKQKLLEARSTPSKQKLVEAKCTPSKQKLVEAKCTPSKQNLLETKKKTPSQEKLAQSTPGKHKLSEPVSAKKQKLSETKSGSVTKILTKAASNQKLAGKIKQAAQLLAGDEEDDSEDDSMEEEETDDEVDEEFDEDDDENDSDGNEEDGNEDDDDDDEDESDNDVEVAPKKQKLAAVVAVKEKQEKKTVKKTDSSGITDEAFNSEKSMLEERDRRTLFVKNLPETVTETQIRSLSANIVSVRIRRSFRQNFKNNRFAFLEFKNEKMATKNLKLLKGKTIDNVTLMFDFVGQKSKSNPKSVQPVDPAEIDPLKLFVTGFEREMTEAQLRALFPSANDVSLPTRKSDGKPVGFAFVSYTSAAKCKEVHDGMQGHLHKGRLLIVLYGKTRTGQGKRKNDSEKGTPSKKQKKPVAKEESSDDDDSDEADDDDSDEDGDDDDEEMDSDEDEEMESEDDDESESD